ncbi:GDT1 family protein [Plasmodiophora brassicae]|uniref:GDT1 family protein n=1 Tax=Plasmodiophora brassicae TaxID=37360 RepID=A0A0G4J2F8_PLABS|nr:hypothetical protein PBRA_008619 [Plasmodiophora brassicae]SPR02015.1 unnamed protein product [Plasmodiophora brassicae]
MTRRAWTLGAPLIMSSFTVAAAESLAAVSPVATLQAVVASFSMVVSSEVGDKTFFIAAILSMRHGRQVVFAGAIAALIVMTVLSAAVGSALPAILPKVYTHYGAVLLFAGFGVKLLKDALEMDPNEASNELEQTEAELVDSKRSEYEGESDIEMADADADVEKGNPRRAGPRMFAAVFKSEAFIQAFTMTFLAEWGDRSQIATIVMAADSDPTGVVMGGIVGHALCTLVAVVGGKLLAQRISERTVHLVGGVLFLCFAVHSVVSG